MWLGSAYPRRASTASAMVFPLAFTGGGRGRREGDHISNGRPRIDLGGYTNSCTERQTRRKITGQRKDSTVSMNRCLLFLGCCCFLYRERYSNLHLPQDLQIPLQHTWDLTAVVRTGEAMDTACQALMSATPQLQGCVRASPESSPNGTRKETRTVVARLSGHLLLTHFTPDK